MTRVKIQLFAHRPVLQRKRQVPRIYRLRERNKNRLVIFKTSETIRRDLLPRALALYADDVK